MVHLSIMTYIGYLFISLILLLYFHPCVLLCTFGWMVVPLPALFYGEDSGAECTGCWMRVHARMTHQPQVWAALHNNCHWSKLKKEHKQQFWKRCLSRNQKDVGMGGWSFEIWLMKFIYREWTYYWLTKCMNKNHSIKIIFVNGYISHNHPNISSSGKAGTTLFADTYVGMVVWNVVIYVVVHVQALCHPVILHSLHACMWTLLASSFIHPSLCIVHLFDFWKKFFKILILAMQLQGIFSMCMNK